MSKLLRSVICGLVAVGLLAPTVGVAFADDSSSARSDVGISAEEKRLTKEFEKETKLSGVQGEYSPKQAESMPNERYSGWPVIGGLLNRVFTTDKNVGKMTFDKSGDVPEGDGTTIENVKVKWLSTTDETLVKTPINNDGQTFGARVDFSLSGQHSYKPGNIEIKLPLNIFKDRLGKDEGALDMSLPEDPAKGAVFTYKRVDDTILVSNTQELPAGYQGYFEVYWDDVIPAEVVSNQLSAPFGAIITVVTNSGNTLQLTSNIINAKILTDEVVTNAYKRGNLYRSLPSNWNKSNMSLPDGFDENDYYYVDWYTYAYISGNTYFNIDVKDTPLFNQPVDKNDPKKGVYADGIVLGGDIPGGKVSNDGKTYTAEGVFSGYRGPGNNFYYHTYTAYPKSQFKDQSSGTVGGSQAIVLGQMKNKVEYTLTTWDDQTWTGIDQVVRDVPHATSRSAVAEVQVREYPWRLPEGHFMLYKWGVGEDGSCSTVDPTHCSGNIGQYPYALNLLAQGQDVDLTYDVVTTNYPYPWTFSGEEGADTKDPANYNKKYVDVDVIDYQTYFHQMTPVDSDPLTVEDFEFKSLRVLDSRMYEYGGSVYNGWNYQVNSSLPRPDITLYGTKDTVNSWDESKSDRVTWVKYGTAKWGDDGKGSLTITPENGATVKGNVLYFPDGAGIQDWRYTYSTNAAGIYTGVLPTMKLRSTDRVRKIVDELMNNSDSASTDAKNIAAMKVTQDGSQLAYFDGNGSQAGHNGHVGIDSLGAASQEVYMKKFVKQLSASEEDKSRQRLRLRYEADVYIPTNLTTDASYNDAVKRGIVPKDESGTYYDLLPLGVRVDETSVQAVGLQSVKTVANWRGSGRTMLIVKVKNSTSPSSVCPRNEIDGSRRCLTNGQVNRRGVQHTISFEAMYTWSDMKDISVYLNNNIAYASDAPFLGTVTDRKGEPDDPAAGNNRDSQNATQGVTDLMKDLLPDNDNASVVYANAGITVHARTYAFTGLQKDVSSDVNGLWGTGLDLKNVDGNIVTDDSLAIDVPTGGTYTYRLRMENDNGRELKNIVFYDDLEAYIPTKDKLDHNKPRWQGKFLGVNVQSLKDRGINPVVYYATGNVDLTQWNVDDPSCQVGDAGCEVGEKGIPDLSDTSVWSTTPPEDTSSVKAIAIDCSKKADGSDFVLRQNESLQATIQMLAPSGEEAKTYTKQDAHAYNNVYLSSTNVTQGGQESNYYIHQDYTKVGLYPFRVSVRKVWNDDNNRDGIRTDHVTIQLKKDGVPEGQPVTLNDANAWKHAYDYLAKCNPDGSTINWSVDETDIPSGYQLEVSNRPTSTGIDVTATNTHEIDRIDISGNKMWSDMLDNAVQPTSIKLSPLADGKKIQTKEVQAGIDGDWGYSFDGLPKNVRENNTTRRITYTMTEEPVEGYISEISGENEGIVVNNRYYPWGDITLTKTASSVTGASQNTEFEFELTLKTVVGKDDDGNDVYDYDPNEYNFQKSDGSTGKIKNGGTVKIKAGQSITVKKIPIRTKYAWSEKASDGFTIGSSSGMEGTITTDCHDKAVVDNVYATTGYVQLKARKVLDGRELQNRQFRFELNLLNNVENGRGNVGELIRTALNDKDGNAQFSRIGYGNPDDGNTYSYVMQETNAAKPGYSYSDALYWVEVTVRDNGNGTMAATPAYFRASKDGDAIVKGEAVDAADVVFNNTYKAEGQLDLIANKMFVGGDLSKKSFKFQLLDGANKAIAEAETDAEGVAKFAPIKYTEADAGKRYTYTVKEVIDENDTTIVWDDHEETVTVEVIDNGDGTLHVNQTFQGQTGEVPLVWKNVAEKGGLRIEKHLADDEQTRSRKDTVFPMEVVLSAPKGGEVIPDADANTGGIQLNVEIYTPKWPTDGSWPSEEWFQDENNFSRNPKTITLKDDRFRISIPAEGYAVVNGLPGGTMYMVTEVASE